MSSVFLPFLLMIPFCRRWMLRVRICGHWLLSGFFVSFHLKVQSRRLILIAFFFILSCRSFHSTTTEVSLILLLLALVLSLWGRTCNSWFWLGWLDATARGTFGDHVNGHDTGLVPRGFVANCFASVSLPSWAGSSWLLSSLFSFKTCPLLYCIVLYTTRLRTEKTSGLIRIKFCSYV